jgi:hypothetical protein
LSRFFLIIVLTNFFLTIVLNRFFLTIVLNRFFHPTGLILRKFSRILLLLSSIFFMLMFFCLVCFRWLSLRWFFVWVLTLWARIDNFWFILLIVDFLRSCAFNHWRIRILRFQSILRSKINICGILPRVCIIY